MAYDRNRPIPWKQLLRFTGIYLVLANVVLYGVGRENYNVMTFVTTIIGGLFYLGFSAVMAKFGLDPVSQRARRMEAAAARRAARTASRSAKSTSKRRSSAATLKEGERPRPAPTSRTNATNRQPKVRR